jgi:transposase
LLKLNAMQKLKIRNAKRVEEQIHQYLKNSDEARFIHRLHGVLLLLNSEENNCATVASLFRNSPRSLSNWVHSINQSGDIQILRDKPRKGRTPRLSAKQIQHLKAIFQEDPSQFELSANIWDGKALAHYIEKKFSVSLQVRQCQRLFHKMGFSLKRARPVPAKGDPEKKELVKKTS